jgi:hypothetical protein
MSVYKCHAFIFLDQPPPWPSRTVLVQNYLVSSSAATKDTISFAPALETRKSIIPIAVPETAERNNTASLCTSHSRLELRSVLHNESKTGSFLMNWIAAFEKAELSQKTSIDMIITPLAPPSRICRDVWNWPGSLSVCLLNNAQRFDAF